MEEIHIFRIKITPQIALDDRATRKALLEATLSDIKKYISDPVISGFNIYSTKAPVEK